MFGERPVPPALQNLHHRLLHESIQPWQCPACALPRPAWPSSLASPVAVDRFHSATVPEWLASTASGSDNSPTVIPSIPRLPWLAFTRRKARFRFSLSQTSSIHGFVPAGLWVSQFAVSDSLPSRRAFRASLLPSTAKASTIGSWFFCRLALI